MLFHIVAFAFVVYHLVKFLRLLEHCCAPQLHHRETKFVKTVVKRCPSLSEIYKPPAVWGKCGHIQTAIYGKLGRYNSPRPVGERFYEKLPTGETFTYDVFEPACLHRFGEDYTVLVCPGIANSSEKAYIRTFIKYAINQGYRVIVLNHIGSLANVKLTSPKIFTYGDTRYFSAMITSVQNTYKNTTYMIVGYSMGANIAMKYLGEDAKNQNGVVCAVSLCQGYDAVRSTSPMKSGYRRIYNRLITMNFKKILRPHWDYLFASGEGPEKAPFNEEQVKGAKSLFDIEDGLLRHIDGHDSVEEYMDKQSCSHVLDNIRIPVLLVNTEDDPVVVNDVHDVPKDHSELNPQAIFATYKFGGHLGCYTGSWYKPDEITLIEKLIIEYSDAVMEMRREKVHTE